MLARGLDGFEAIGALGYDLHISGLVQILPQDLASQLFVVHDNGA